MSNQRNFFREFPAFFVWTLVFISLFGPTVSFAGVGVGLNFGRIVVDELLKPGATYDLPTIGVINTGDTEGEFQVSLAYHQDQPQERPDPAWLGFSPSSFKLAGGELKNVSLQLELPLKIKPGDYFAYIEAKPILKQESGTTFGIAAASELHFRVVPANIFQGIYYRFSSFLNRYSPWTYVIILIVAFAFLAVLLGKLFSFQVNIKRKKHE
ncbi:MAG: hypothetical protein Q8N65_03385 [bacterium]|nr:hypothetical protein [bacterium]